MTKWRLVPLLAVLTVVVWMGNAFAQDTLWVDRFEDDDPPAHKNVGWLYYGPEDGLMDQVVEQQNLEGNGVLYIKAGNYQVIGVGLIETNGTPEVDPEDEAKTHQLLVANNYSSPNQMTTFRVNFKTIVSENSFFGASARMVQTDTSESIPDADPTESPAYVVFISPSAGVVRLAKYPAVQYAGLDPTTWAYLGEAPYAFDLDVFYWVKFYLKDAEFKVKVWEGDPEDEPADWLIEATDSEPRVTGKFNMFSLMGNPPGGDEFYLDDIVLVSTGPTAVETDPTLTPESFELAQNYPNPFNPTTEVSYSVPKNGHVLLEVYNTLGQKVRTLVNADVAAGSHRVTFNGRDDLGRSLSSGVYVYRLSAGDQVTQKKMMLTK